MEAGVPQDAVLSPFFYKIYVSDQPRTQRTSIALYADDTTIMAWSRSGRLLTWYLQEETTVLEKWCNKSKIDLNEEKTQAKVFLKKRTKDEDRRQRQVKRHGHRVVQRGDVPWGQDGQKLTWGSHIEYARQKARATGAKLYPKQDIEAGTSEQSDSHQFSSSNAPDLRLGRVGVRDQIAPIETPSYGKHCAQDSGGRPMVRQKCGHPARHEVYHRNGKDRTKRSEYIPKGGKQRKSVTARSSELRPGARSTPQTTPIPAIG